MDLIKTQIYFVHKLHIHINALSFMTELKCSLRISNNLILAIYRMYNAGDGGRCCSTMIFQNLTHILLVAPPPVPGILHIYWAFG